MNPEKPTMAAKTGEKRDHRSDHTDKLHTPPNIKDTKLLCAGKIFSLSVFNPDGVSMVALGTASRTIAYVCCIQSASYVGLCAWYAYDFS
jgi:hypothetical protein